MQINVVDSHSARQPHQHRQNQHQLRLPRVSDGNDHGGGDGLEEDIAASSSLAVVSSSSRGGGFDISGSVDSNINSGIFFDSSVMGEGVGASGGRGGRGGGDEARGDGIPRRRRGPAPLHFGGEESLDGIIGEEGGAAHGNYFIFKCCASTSARFLSVVSLLNIYIF